MLSTSQAEKSAKRPQGQDVIGTGIAGLDEILMGGLTKDRVYLVEGVPGSGKTTLALQFLIEGMQRGENVLYITLSETVAELHGVAFSHGWDLTGLPICEVAPPEDSLDPDQEYSVFHPAEVELSAATQTILAAILKYSPSRVVFDSLSELRLLANTALRYRRQVLALKQYFIGRGCTVLLLDDRTGGDNDVQVQSIAHGVIVLEQNQPNFGRERRRVRIAKYRGVGFRGGYHDCLIRRGGLAVFPRAPISHAPDSRETPELISSGVKEFDEILSGGIEAGSNTLVTGAAGTGKSTIAATFVVEAARRGEKAAMFLFDESSQMLTSRMRALGYDMAPYLDNGLITLQQVDAAELSPGEFSSNARKAADDGARVIVIDSLNGYLHAMTDETFLVVQLRELLSYLGTKKTATILVSVHAGLIGSQMSSPVDASYLADGIILLRYFEAAGRVHQALSVVKKRGGAHERTLREFKITSAGIKVGEPLVNFRGVLTGTPTYDGHAGALFTQPARE